MNMASGSPLVSVIIPTRNRVALLGEAVRSVLRQPLPCEVIVVDDASSDGTAEWLAQQANAWLIAINLKAHQERSFARNRGLEAARGKSVLFLDDDDRLHPSALLRLHAALAATPNALGAVGAQLLFDEHGSRRRLSHPHRSFERVVWKDLLAGWTSPSGAILWRTDLISAAGGFNEQIKGSEDYELWIRVASRGPVVFVPTVVLEKRTHSGQFRRADRREYQARWRRAYIEKLPPGQRETAVRFSRTHRLLNDARIAYGNLEFREAIALDWRAIMLTPSILLSPLLRPQIAVRVSKSVAALVVGGRGVLQARRAKHAVRRALGREVEEVKIRRNVSDAASS
jgi:glycosyltransferase involved in cell wall biosynthesis